MVSCTRRTTKSLKLRFGDHEYRLESPAWNYFDVRVSQLGRESFDSCLFLGYSGPCAVCFVGVLVVRIVSWGRGRLGRGAVRSCLFLARRCGGDVEAFFRSALSLDLLPNGLEAEWSTRWTRLLEGHVRGWGRAYYLQRL